MRSLLLWRRNSPTSHWSTLCVTSLLLCLCLVPWYDLGALPKLRLRAPKEKDEFLKKATSIKPETTANQPDGVIATKPKEVTTTVAIIGAGAAGLSAAYTLESNGVDYIILEASNDLGGRVKKDTTFTNGSFPLDLGASFIQFPKAIRPIVGRDELMGLVPGTHEYNWVNYTYHDFFNDYIAPKNTSKIHYDCRVQSVDYTDSEIVKTTCHDGTSFTSQQAIVTVPLSILKAGKIDFKPQLPSKLTVGHPGVMWGGFKIFIEFKKALISKSFCSAKCYSDNGETFFWDVPGINQMLPNGNTILLGYIVGTPNVKPSFTENDDDAIWKFVMQMLDDRFDGQASETYVKHMVVNWSKNPDINGTYSSRAYGEPGARNVKDRVWIAGEAFPTKKIEEGWVDAGAFSGDDAAKQILNLKAGLTFDDKSSFWKRVARDLGRGG